MELKCVPYRKQSLLLISWLTLLYLASFDTVSKHIQELGFLNLSNLLTDFEVLIYVL